MDRKRMLKVAAGVVAWAVVAVPVAIGLFTHSERPLVLASHESVLRPNFSGEVVVHTGPVLPDARQEVDGPVGVDITLGKTEASSLNQLIDRYAFIASNPDSQIDKVREAVVDMALSAAIRGAVAGLIPLGVWWLLGPVRRHRIWVHLHRPRELGMVVAATLVAGLVVWQPWQGEDPALGDDRWQSLAGFLGPTVQLPPEAADIDVSDNPTAWQTQRLVESAIGTYNSSKGFYDDLAEQAAGLRLRVPAEDETVAVVVSDRHDNIGMDRVARAIADAAGATVVLDAGDDTSTGDSWEAFSLDSLDRVFGDLVGFSVAGNHDSGDFVSNYLSELGWTNLRGHVVPGPGGSTILGIDDPRSSGLGNWRDESGIGFDEQAELLADEACAADEPVGTMLVHDVDLAWLALQRGCVDLAVGGHLHVREGPVPVVGANGNIGHRYTTGTTGGAAYAIAVGSKLKRAAMVSLITYRDRRPVGVQWVTIETNRQFQIGAYVELVPDEDSEVVADVDRSRRDQSVQSGVRARGTGQQPGHP